MPTKFTTQVKMQKMGRNRCWRKTQSKQISVAFLMPRLYQVATYKNRSLESFGRSTVTASNDHYCIFTGVLCETHTTHNKFSSG